MIMDISKTNRKKDKGRCGTPLRGAGNHGNIMAHVPFARRHEPPKTERAGESLRDDRQQERIRTGDGLTARKEEEQA